jgi:hypothetical protein
MFEKHHNDNFVYAHFSIIRKIHHLLRGSKISCFAPSVNSAFSSLPLLLKNPLGSINRPNCLCRVVDFSLGLFPLLKFEISIQTCMNVAFHRLYHRLFKWSRLWHLQSLYLLYNWSSIFINSDFKASVSLLFLKI